MPEAQEQVRIRRLILPIGRDDDKHLVDPEGLVLHIEPTQEKANSDYQSRSQNLSGEDDCGGEQVITGGMENSLPQKKAKAGGQGDKQDSDQQGNQDAQQAGGKNQDQNGGQAAQQAGGKDQGQNGGQDAQQAGGKDQGQNGGQDAQQAGHKKQDQNGGQDAQQAGDKKQRQTSPAKPGESYPGESRVQQSTAELMVALQDAKEQLAKEMEANLTQLKAVLKETQRIAKEMEAVLNEAKNEGSPEEMSMGQAPWDPPGQKKEAKGKGEGKAKAKQAQDQEIDPWEPEMEDDQQQDEWKPPNYH